MARRLLKEAGGDEAAAFERWLRIHDLEQGCEGQLELSGEAVECAICVDLVGAREAVRLRPCGHGWFCVACFQQAVDVKVSDGATLGAIGCPECRRGLSESLLRALLTKDQMDKLHRQSLESAVGSCVGLRPCPTPDCPNRVVVEDGVEARLNCDMCGKEHCLLCSASPYHRGKTCSEHRAEARAPTDLALLQRWMAEVGAKQCPKCRAVVTKSSLEDQKTQNSECHKMICRTCRTKFCFGCLAVLTESYSCGCTPDSHGFIDPDTHGFVSHLSRASRSVASRGGRGYYGARRGGRGR